jgi:hypothetical protein
MEELNIAAILKDKPKGTKLYADAFGELRIEEICPEDELGITLSGKDGDELFFYNDGKYIRYGESILVPSKSMRDWSKFAWKKGDLLTYECGFQCIFKEWASDDYTKFNGCYSNSRDGYEDVLNTETAKFEKLDDNIAHDYIKEIERKLGGKLNLETLKVEKQPEFKDGDILFTKTNMLHFSSVFILDTNRNEMRSYVRFLIERGHIDYGMPVYNLDTNRFRYATEEEKKQFFDALAKKGKAWDAEKKAIVDLKPKCEFKPFDRCIWKIRNCEGSIWQASFVSYVDEYGATPMGMSIDEDLVNLIILPYNEETKLLVGTTDEWEGGEQ